MLREKYFFWLQVGAIRKVINFSDTRALVNTSSKVEKLTVTVVCFTACSSREMQRLHRKMSNDAVTDEEISRCDSKEWGV